jgi:hypothetical protein
MITFLGNVEDELPRPANTPGIHYENGLSNHRLLEHLDHGELIASGNQPTPARANMPQESRLPINSGRTAAQSGIHI